MYQQALEHLNQLANYERRLPHHYDKQTYGIDRARRLLECLGRPHHAFPALHVAGTNGKGSTCAMAEAILRALGLRCGLFTSPHLVDVRERFTVDGVWASEYELAALVARVRDATDRMDDGELVTFFEVLTALGFIHFADRRVDAAVVEVGMGGRLDSTNVLEPRACAITPIGLDHTRFLGDTVEQIAGEKAGIIKPGVPVVTTATGIARDVISARADALGCPLFVIGEAFDAHQEAEGRWTIRTPELVLDKVELGLRGRYQGANAACAVMLAQLFLGDTPAPEAVRRGLADARWPGRFQVISGQPPLVLDGAMNAQGARALREALDEAFPNRPRAFVLGISSDKDPNGVVRELLPGAIAVVCTAASTPRAMPPRELLAAISEVKAPARLSVEPDVRAAITAACAQVGDSGLVCVTGSLYLVGEALKQLVDA